MSEANMALLGVSESRCSVGSWWRAKTNRGQIAGGVSFQVTNNP